MRALLTELLYVAGGLLSLYTAIKTITAKNHPSRIPTALFWFILAVIFIFSRVGVLFNAPEIQIPNVVVGYLVLALAVLSAIKKVKMRSFDEASAEEKEAAAKRLGNKIFIPALTLAIVTFIVAQLWPKQIGSIVSLGIGALAASILALIITRGKPAQMMHGGSRLLEMVGPMSLLPQVLAALGAVFAAAGVGTVIAGGLQSIIPQDNRLAGVIVYCLGMPLFTMIMGNAFAAFAVITAGIGIPFVMALGGNPVIVGALGLTAGYCGTLLTPMAANFNIVPAVVLEAKDTRWGLIKFQAPVAGVLLIAHIALMYFWAF